MIKQGGEWKTVDWQTALEYVARGLTQIAVEHGAQSIGALATPHSHASRSCTCSAKLVRGLGSDNIDYRLRDRLRAAPARAIALARHARSPRCPSLERVARRRLVPAQGPSAVRAAPPPGGARRARKVMSVHALRDDWLMPMGAGIAAAPSAWVEALADDRRRDRRGTSGIAAPAEGRSDRRGEGDRRRAGRAASARRCCSATPPRSIPTAPPLERLARWIAEQTGATFGCLVDGGQQRRRAARRRRCRAKAARTPPRCSAPARRSRPACC